MLYSCSHTEWRYMHTHKLTNSWLWIAILLQCQSCEVFTRAHNLTWQSWNLILPEAHSYRLPSSTHLPTIPGKFHTAGSRTGTGVGSSQTGHAFPLSSGAVVGGDVMTVWSTFAMRRMDMVGERVGDLLDGGLLLSAFCCSTFYQFMQLSHMLLPKPNVTDQIHTEADSKL